MSDNSQSFFSKVDKSALLTVIGILFLFSSAIGITLIAPVLIEKAWTEPTSYYQVQMYEVADPNLYISNQGTADHDLQMVHHLKQGYTLLSFKETGVVRIVASPELEKYITRLNDSELKLTSHLLLLRTPQKPREEALFNPVDAANTLRQKLQQETLAKGEPKIDYDILELYDPGITEAFSFGSNTDSLLEDWVDEHYTILDDTVNHPYHQHSGVIYVHNPREFRVARIKFGDKEEWHYSADGERIASLQELKSAKYGFLSRKELIEMGEDIYKAEGCWYCHSDQTRTLIQDLVLNGSESEPAPPSTPNEYIYQRTTFPGTRRIGPDLSRVGVKRPSRDWHKAHFWSPKTASTGSIMPSFKHFFDNDPRGTSRRPYGVPNYKFEAVFQYLMTKGTRINPPTQAWWLGKDPVQTKAIIEGRKRL